MPSSTEHAQPLRLTWWLAIKVLLLGALAVGAFTLAERTSELVASAVVLPLALIGVVGRHDIRADRSRVPEVAQGLCVGLFVGTAIGITVFDGWSPVVWAWTFPMIVLFPAVLPPRLRRGMAAKIEPDEAAIARAGQRWPRTPN